MTRTPLLPSSRGDGPGACCRRTAVSPACPLAASTRLLWPPRAPPVQWQGERGAAARAGGGGGQGEAGTAGADEDEIMCTSHKQCMRQCCL